MLESIGYLDEINSVDNLKSIIDRFPFHLKAKWLEVADSIQESGQRPRIHNISKFVSEKARAANNPVLGDALNSDKDKSKKDRSGKKTFSPWRHPMLLMETSVGRVLVYRTQVKIRIIRLPRGEDDLGVENVYFVMSFISYGTVNSLRRNPLRIE